MTPKEKAIELVESMAFSCRECDYEFKAKQCALITVDEIFEMDIPIDDQDEADKFYDYWDKVKQEIEKL